MIKNGSRVHWLMYALFWLALATVARAGEVADGGSSTSGVTVYTRRIPVTAQVNDFSSAIPACVNMAVYWEQGNSGAATLYPADSDDDTSAEIEANTPIKAFTTNEYYGLFTPTKRYVRFVVDTVNATVPSTAVVICSNLASDGGGGGGLANVVEDTSPTLGGALDAATNTISDVGQIKFYNASGSTTVKRDATSLFVDQDNDGTKDVATTSGGGTGVEASPMYGERDPALGLSDDIWIEEFASGSSTFGLQEAINHVCTTQGISNAAYGARIRLRGDAYNFGTNTISIPCHGVWIEGASPDLNNEGILAGTLLITEQGSSGFSFISVTASKNNVRIRNLAIAVANPGASTIAINVGDSVGYFELDHVSCTATLGGGDSPTVDADGVCLKMDDPIYARVHHNNFDGLGTDVLQVGTLGPGSNSYSHNRFSSNTAAGIGLQIGNGGFACTNVSVENNTFEGNFRGLVVDTASSICSVSVIGNHFENGVTNAKDVVATGDNSVSFINNYFSPAAIRSFERTSMTGATTFNVDTFFGNSIFSDITMTAGKCVMLFPSGSLTTADLTACKVLAIDSTGIFSDINGDLDFDSGTDLRLDDADLIDLADGSLTYTKLGVSGTPNGTKFLRDDGSWAAAPGAGSSDINAVGTCLTGDCFNDILGLGTPTVGLFSSSDFGIVLDQDENSTSFFSVQAVSGGSPFTVATVGETGQLTLGSTTPANQGSIRLRGSTSGMMTLSPPSGAIGTYTVTFPNAASTLPIFGQQITFSGPTAARTVTLPDANFTVARTDAANTFTGVQTMTSPVLTTPNLGTPSTLVLTNASGSLNLGTGTIQGAVKTETTSSTAYTMNPATGQWIFMDETGATQIELPAVSAGASVCIYSATAQVISLNPNGTENIFLAGATIGAGDELDSPGALGDYACLLSNGTNWYVLGLSGTWIDGGAS